jgi:hypothetical protein
LSVYLLDKALDIARQVKTLLNLEGGVIRGAAPDTDRRGDRARHRKKAQQPTSEQSNQVESKRRKFSFIRKIQSKKRELSLIREKMDFATNPKAKRIHNKRRKRARQRKRARLELFQLQRELDAPKEGVDSEPDTGTLPDFVIIGAQKGGTDFLYHLLTHHPLVESAAFKEVHFFDRHFDKGVEWYCRCFPHPKWKGGRRTITGEATPYYLFHRPVAQRMAEMVPQARLIALLRNPVTRAYSHYQMQVRRGQEPRTFEEVTEAEATRLRAEGNEMLEDKQEVGFKQQHYSYLSRGVYVNQLLRWSEFFSKEQMLVLKSEDFFERPVEILKVVLAFLDLPEWEPKASELQERRHEGSYEQEMDPSTRQRLEAFFEPHNRRLYDYLGVDFGW